MATWNLRLDAPLHLYAHKKLLLDAVRQTGGQVEYISRRLPWVSIVIPDDTIDQIALPGVTAIESDSECTRCVNTLIAPTVWTLDMIRADMAHQITRGKGAVIAVLDTGISLHQEFEQADLEIAQAFTPYESPLDLNGHGTATIGIVCAQGKRALGIAPDAHVISIKVLDRNGIGKWSWVAAGIEKAVDKGADVVLMALGGKQPSMMVEDAMRLLASTGGIPVVAAGNDSSRVLDFPGASGQAITVAAVDEQGHVARWSSWAPQPTGPDIAAPGVLVPVLRRNDEYGMMNGTSPASAIVAGCIALLYTVNKRVKTLHATDAGEQSAVAAIRHKLYRTARPLHAPIERVGYGLIDAYALVGGV